MMKVLLLLNVNNTVIGTFACQKGGQKGQKSSKKEVLPKMAKWVKKEVKKGQRSTGVVNVKGKSLR